MKSGDYDKRPEGRTGEAFYGFFRTDLGSQPVLTEIFPDKICERVTRPYGNEEYEREEGVLPS